MFDVGARAFTIHRLDLAQTTWSDTGVVIDGRKQAHMDVLSDGSKLYVASAGPTGAEADSANLIRFTYDDATSSYSRDSGYPVTPVSGGMEAIVLDRDSAGTVWLTYTRNNAVYITHNEGPDNSWATPFTLPVPGADTLTPDDISALVAFDGNVGVMWGNQNEDAYYFAVHVDGTAPNEWTREVAYKMPEAADDHINIKSIHNDPEGRIFAVVKTSLSGDGDPLVVVLVRRTGGAWDTDNVFGRHADDHSRPILVVDREHDRVYAFATGPCCSGGTVYMKSATVKALLNGNPFGNGRGTPFIESPAAPKINNPTSTKQSVSSSTGLVVLASDNSTRTYWHNRIDLGAPTTAEPDTSPPQTVIDAGASETSSPSVRFEFSADEAGSSFECRLDGAGWTRCSSPEYLTGLVPGEHTFEVRATDAAGNTDPTPASRTWTVDSGPTGTRTYEASRDAYVAADNPNSNLGSDVRLFADGAPQREIYVGFDVDSASDRVVQSATLRVFVTNGTTKGPTVHLITSVWSENQVTWASRPSSGPPIASAGSVAKGQWLEFDVTAAVKSSGSVNFALVGQSRNGMTIRSRETSDQQPELVVVQ